MKINDKPALQSTPKYPYIATTKEGGYVIVGANRSFTLDAKTSGFAGDTWGEENMAHLFTPVVGPVTLENEY